MAAGRRLLVVGGVCLSLTLLGIWLVRRRVDGNSPIPAQSPAKPLKASSPGPNQDGAAEASGGKSDADNEIDKELDRQVAATPPQEDLKIPSPAELDGRARRHPLTPEEEKRLDVLQGDVESSPSPALFRSIATARSTGAKELFLRASLVASFLSRHPESIAGIRSQLQSPQIEGQEARDLLLVLGKSGTSEARKALLEWLADPQLRAFGKDILEALFQAPASERSQLERGYHDYLHDDGRPWPHDLSSTTRVSDSTVLRATAERLSNSSSAELSGMAAKLLCHLSSQELSDIPPEVQTAIRGGFLDVLRKSDDPALVQAAVLYLRRETDAETNMALWERYGKAEPQSRIRVLCAAGLARNAQSIPDVSRVFAVMQDEKDSVVRQTFLDGFAFASLDHATRAAIASSIASWVIHEPMEDVRLEAVGRLEQLLPDSEANLSWALQDSSAQVRAKAEEVVAKVGRARRDAEREDAIRAKKEELHKNR